MSREFLQHYETELKVLRSIGSEFAKQHPKAAGHLAINAGQHEDPMVSRLMEGFAFYTARIKSDLDRREKSQLIELLGFLYPHFLRPKPSFTMLQFSIAEHVDKPVSIKPNTEMTCETVDKETCIYRNAELIQLLPLRITHAEYRKLPHSTQQADMYVHISAYENTNISDATESYPLRIAFLDDNAINMYEQLAFNLKKIELIINNHTHPIPKKSIRMVGFDQSELLLPKDDNSFYGLQLLTEFSYYMQRFLAIEIDLPKELLEKEKNIKLKFHFSEYQKNLESIAAENLRVNCYPVINLFKTNAEPIFLDHKTQSYHLKANNQKALRSQEIYNIISMEGINNNTGNKVPFRSLYASDFHQYGTQHYWTTTPTPSWEYGDANIKGYEYELKFVSNHQSDNLHNSPWSIQTQVNCSNRDICDQLSYVSSAIHFKFKTHLDDRITDILCCYAPTSTYRQNNDTDTLSKLLSHIKCNYLALDNHQLHPQLINILQLYNQHENYVISQFINAIVRIDRSATTSRMLQQGRSAIVSGTLLTITLNHEYGYLPGVRLFSHVLTVFLNHYCTINHFVELRIIDTQNHEIMTCRPTHGTQSLL